MTGPGGAQSASLVAVRAVPEPRFAEALEQAWARGDAVLPLAPSLPPAEEERLLAHLRPALLEGRALPDPLPVEPGTALVVATSGTTGEPKGAVLTFDNLRAAAAASAARLGSDPADRWLCCLPVHHIAGLMVLVRSLLAGSEPVIHPRFDPEAVAAEGAADLVSLVPAMLARLLETGAGLSRFRRILLGGGPIPAGMLGRAAAAGARVVTSYGATETCGGVVYDGLPLDGVEVALAADGEVLLRGPMVTRGYRGRPNLTGAALAGGWFHTGDCGDWEPGGRLRILGRRDGIISTGGEKVAPEEVEAILRSHPLVADAGVTALPDSVLGERVVALVVPAGREAPALEDLRRYVSAVVPSYKAPRQLVLVERIPRTDSGKPFRAGLAALAVTNAEGVGGRALRGSG